MNVWSPLAKGTWPLQVLALMGLLALLMGVAYSLHLRPLLMQAGQGAGQLSLEGTSSTEGAATLHSRLHQARRQLLAVGEEPELFETLSRLAEAHAVVIEQLQVLDVLATEHYQGLPLQLRLSGAFSALVAFFTDLAGQSRLVTVHALSLKPVDAGLVLVELQARSYRPHALHSLEQGPPPEPAERRIVAALRNPFAPAAPQAAVDVLQGLALEQFEMVGSLASGGAYYALVQAQGRVYRLQIGDRLGRDEGQVVEVSERQLAVVEQVFVAGQGWQARRRTLALR
ncbi:pilus assembly protein PilP [Pseudomonas rubra]|uniref:Pilus assembly protein PilP n=1 Tax=Pseudomonas rubra TaxID=2942627 RepID=A0ABT5P723_9PSED|nr:pilus assembly protein PilP [Pseudomonas rubra]MDD1013971.1 pilus assembly protein PilP [Pseudomonas rubra]MDD1038905.1 pilus assembly protein PilP [Pseudomonas rubra]MDD1154341.1 pilus assembly protein PilP [Pseudomonas rubra]